MYHLVADTQTMEMMDLPLPEAQYKTIPIPPSEAQQYYVKTFGERAERIRQGGVDPAEDNMLCITNDGRKLALDQRLIDPTLPDDPNSKTNVCADLVYQRWLEGKDQKLTQVIFCDVSTPKKGEFNVYDDLKEKLVARGIPSDEIRFVHEAKTDAQKDALFSQVRSGDVRVIMGSTRKLGTGTNIQTLLADGYDLDCPWRPSDLEQRLRRVVRQKNKNEFVTMTRFVKEGTFDAYMYQLLETKQRFISQIRNGSFTGRSAEDVDQATLNYAEIKALASGDPRIREKVELEIDVSKLSLLFNRHRNHQLYLQRQVEKTLPVKIESSQKRIFALEADIELLREHPSKDAEGSLLPATVQGQLCETTKESGQKLYAALQEIPEGEKAILGTLRGITIYGEHPRHERPYFILGNASQTTVSPYNLDGRLSEKGLLWRMHNTLDRLPETLKDEQRSLRNTQQLFHTSLSEYGKSFDREEELRDKTARLKELNELLDLDQQSALEAASNDIKCEELEEKAVLPSLDKLLEQASARQSQRSTAQIHHIPGPIHRS